MNALTNATNFTLTENHAITIKGYAVQSDNFASAQAAWDATFGA